MSNAQMIAPCGVECSHCIHYLANTDTAARKQGAQWSSILGVSIEMITCKGCRGQAGQIPFQKHLFGDSHRCSIHRCAQRRKIEYCGYCDHFPCDKRHPYTENAEQLTQKVKALFCL